MKINSNFDLNSIKRVRIKARYFNNQDHAEQEMNKNNSVVYRNTYERFQIWKNLFLLTIRDQYSDLFKRRK
jgi:hypothetical protein